MKRMLWVLPAILVFCAVGRAQEVPQWEIFGGYSYLRANLGGSGSSLNLNGGGGSLGQNMNDWFGGKLEVRAYSGTSNRTRITAQTVTFGPDFAYRRWDKITPYAHIEFGLIHSSAGYLGTSESATKFAMPAGGGVDINLSERAAVRVQGEYLLTRYFNQRQDNLQFSTGLVIRFGRAHW